MRRSGDCWRQVRVVNLTDCSVFRELSRPTGRNMHAVKWLLHIVAFLQV